MQHFKVEYLTFIIMVFYVLINHCPNRKVLHWEEVNFFQNGSGEIDLQRNTLRLALAAFSPKKVFVMRVGTDFSTL